MKGFTHIREQLITARFLDQTETRDTIHWNTYNITSCQYSRLTKLVFTHSYEIYDKGLPLKNNR